MYIKKALLIDDDPFVLDLMQHLIESLHYDPFISVRPLEVPELIKNFKPDILIMDVHMPGQNGIQKKLIVRQNAATKDLPIVLYSGDPSHKATGLAAGANDFSAKPFDLDDMTFKINMLLMD